jgi:ABC-type phosphate transport system permease subunit
MSTSRQAASPLDLGALMFAALVLLILTLVVNMGGEWIMYPRSAGTSPAAVGTKGLSK